PRQCALIAFFPAALGLCAERTVFIADPVAARAFKDKFAAITDAWVNSVEFHSRRAGRYARREEVGGSALEWTRRSARESCHRRCRAFLRRDGRVLSGKDSRSHRAGHVVRSAHAFRRI